MDIREIRLSDGVPALEFIDEYGRKAYIYFHNNTFVFTESIDSSGAANYVQFSYYTDGSYYYRQGVRGGAFVVDRYKTGGDFAAFNSGGGVQDTDYELITQAQ